jgi:hypothetical protein
MNPRQHLEDARDIIASEKGWSASAYIIGTINKRSAKGRKSGPVCGSRHCTVGALAVAAMKPIPLPEKKGPKRDKILEEWAEKFWMKVHEITDRRGGDREVKSWRYLRDAVVSLQGPAFDYPRGPETFNEGATQAQVLAMFDKAIEFAEKDYPRKPTSVERRQRQLIPA